MSARGESSGGARPSSWDGAAASGGAAFALLYAGGFVLHGLASGADEESRADVVARYADGGNELLIHVGGLLIGFSVVCLLPFLGRLRAALRDVEGPRAVFSTAAVGGGLLLATLAAVSAAVGIAAFSSSDFYAAYRVDPDVVLLMQTFSFAALGYALVGGAVLVGATSVVGLRPGCFRVGSRSPGSPGIRPRLRGVGAVRAAAAAPAPPVGARDQRRAWARRPRRRRRRGRGRHPHPSPQLTAREHEVLELIAQGESNHAIARRFTLSEKTVRNHVSNVFTKLQVADRAQAIVKAREAGIGIESPPLERG